MDYYQILGVNHTASEAEIKRAYRRLAVSYHPDKNPDPQAENIFKQVNEAYDILSDPEKKRQYDLKLQNPFMEWVPESSTPRHRDPAYRPSRPKVYRKSEGEKLHELMAEHLPLAQKSTLLCFTISICLLIDFAWPARVSKEEINSTFLRRTYSRNSSTTWWVIETSGGHIIDLPFEVSELFQKGQSVTIHSSFFLHIPSSVETTAKDVKIWKSIYGNFIFAPTALLIISTLGMIFRKNIEYGFNLGVVSFVVLLFTGAIVLIL